MTNSSLDFDDLSVELPIGSTERIADERKSEDLIASRDEVVAVEVGSSASVELPALLQPTGSGFFGRKPITDGTLTPNCEI